ncbi:MAG: glycoside hydrolase family 2 [Clostridia bacterium]|nr:glycoside hydrolase family 2 [Clostridia bacterium]
MDIFKTGYPRPQFVRRGWESLNGPWTFAFDDENIGEDAKWYAFLPSETVITVPFSYESEFSGINDQTPHEYVWYQKKITIDEKELACHNYIIHFEAVDYLSKVWVNGMYVGSHEGGYTRFSFDITRFVKDGENTVTVKAEDKASVLQMRGKQRWKKENYSVFYTQTTGIWKQVWGEYVPRTSISSVKMTPHLNGQSLEVEAFIEDNNNEENLMLEAQVTFKGNPVRTVSTSLLWGHAQFDVDVRSRVSDLDEPLVKTWTPENPNLYDIRFRLIKDDNVLDEVYSYFAMREIRIEGNRILLNGFPLYQRLLLNQGYWSKSLLTPPDDEALKKDISLIKSMGYNGVRMHQKVEDERFFYYADTMGLITWCEAPAYFYDRSDAANAFISQWNDILRQYYNHPSIITWTPFNESWGITNIKNNVRQQNLTKAVYYLTKTYDPYRPVITNDGWEHTISDIVTVHDYNQNAESIKNNWTGHKDEILSSNTTPYTLRAVFSDGYSYQGQPIIFSEYGGIAIRPETPGQVWGNLVEKHEFLDRYGSITRAIREIPYASGFCYTQFTDVQQEINGMVDMDRNLKVNPEEIRAINMD